MEKRGVLLNRCLASSATATTDPRRTGFSVRWSEAFNLAAVRSRPRRRSAPRRGARHEAGFVERDKDGQGRSLLRLANLARRWRTRRCGPAPLHHCPVEAFVSSLQRGTGQNIARLVHKGEYENSFRLPLRPERFAISVNVLARARHPSPTCR